jgi:hypothetical protein
MKTHKSRLSTIAIVALAAFAALGWIRQPVASENREKRRPLTLDELTVTKKSRTAELSTPATDVPRWNDIRQAESPIRISQPSASTDRFANRRVASAGPSVKVPGHVAAPKAAEPAIRAKQPPPPAVKSPQPDVDRQRRETASARRDDVDDIATPAPSAVRTTASAKESKMRTVAIIAGTTAAGAVVGGLAGGGKGAAIGAAVGAAGGYVYDRVRRDDDDPYGQTSTQNGGSTSSSATGQTDNDLVSRYGSPSFLGR